jgi:hypothetical protein
MREMILCLFRPFAFLRGWTKLFFDDSPASLVIRTTGFDSGQHTLPSPWR